MDKDLYQILGVDRNVDEKTLKAAYRKLAVKHHPDKNQGNAKAEQKFKEISFAYDTLKDPQKRAAYDRYGMEGLQGGGGRQQAGGFGDAFSSVFEEVFGGGFGGFAQQSRQPDRGSDLRYDMEVTLEEAFHGKTATIKLPTQVDCENCEGSGQTSDSEIVNCKTCGGMGRVRMQQGFFSVERPCPDCGGAGQSIQNPCSDCRGQGRRPETRTLEISIPAGVDDGTRLRLPNEGEAGLRGSGNGDLYIFVFVKPHKLFQREDTSLLCAVPIGMTDAALGGEIEVPGIGGNRLKISIPEGTQNGQRVRLKGHGMPKIRNGQRGDLYVDFQVEVPVNLNKKQKQLLTQFAASLGGKQAAHHSPKSDGFFSKVKDLWTDLTE